MQFAMRNSARGHTYQSSLKPRSHVPFTEMVCTIPTRSYGCLREQPQQVEAEQRELPLRLGQESGTIGVVRLELRDVTLKLDEVASLDL